MSKHNKHMRDTVIVVLKTLALPVIVWITMEIIVRASAGTSVISNSADVKTFFRNMVSTIAFSLAISSNLNCGRMDLSLGAQMYAGTIFGGTIALNMGWGGLGVLICAGLVGGICGLIIGVLFVNMKILPMVLGLGMTLVFECLCFTVNNQQGITVYGKPGIAILSNVYFIIFITILIVIASTYLFQLSRFGYQYRVIQGSQKLASDAGINIFSNCILCYLIAGILVACAGVFVTAYNGLLAPVLGMSSNGYVFSNMFPMALGAWIGGICHNRQIGVVVGAISVNLLILTLSKLGLGMSTQNVIIYSIFLLFIIYNANKGKIDYVRAKNRRINLAKQMSV